MSGPWPPRPPPPRLPGRRCALMASRSLSRNRRPGRNRYPNPNPRLNCERDETRIPGCPRSRRSRPEPRSVDGPAVRLQLRPAGAPGGHRRGRGVPPDGRRGPADYERRCESERADAAYRAWAEAHSEEAAQRQAEAEARWDEPDPWAYPEPEPELGEPEA